MESIFGVVNIDLTDETTPRCDGAFGEYHVPTTRDASMVRCVAFSTRASDCAMQHENTTYAINRPILIAERRAEAIPPATDFKA